MLLGVDEFIYIMNLYIYCGRQLGAINHVDILDPFEPEHTAHLLLFRDIWSGKQLNTRKDSKRECIIIGFSILLWLIYEFVILTMFHVT